MRVAGCSNNQPMRERNIEALVSYFQAGCKVPEKTKLGVEVEYILADASGKPLTYSGEHGVAWVLRQLAEKYPRVTEHDGDILGVAASWMNVTIEPAAQMELSAGPFACLERFRAAFEQFQADVMAIIGPLGYNMLSIGYDPCMRAIDKELIPKERYRCMNRALSDISPSGPRMMRGTASTQVSVDYVSEHDAVQKMRVASALAPILALMMDNAPVYEGKPSPHKLMRVGVWRDLGPQRCNTVPCVFDADFGFRKYAEYLLDVPAIVVPDETTGDVRADDRTFGEIYAQRPMDEAELFHALGMVWPDARLKDYVEIRPADAAPLPYVLAYTALIKGLFYGQACDALARQFATIDVGHVEEPKTALMAEGYQATVFGRPVGEYADELLELARTNLASEEASFLDPLADLVSRRTTLADLS